MLKVGGVRPVRRSVSSDQAALAETTVVPCELCGSRTATELFIGRDRLLGLPGRFGVQQCRECGFIYTSPRPTEEALSRYYPKEYGVYSLEGARALRVFFYQFRIAEWLNRLVSGSDRRVLDIGCGDGAFLALMKECGWQAYGLEMDAGAAERAQSRDGLEVVQGTVEGAAFQPGQFHLITLSHVLEHLSHPRPALQKIREWLRDDGTLYISLPNVESWERRVFGERWYPWDIPRHLLHFSPGALSRLLEEEGYSVTEIRFLSGFFLPQSIRYWRQDRAEKQPNAGVGAHRENQSSSANTAVGSSRLADLKELLKTLIFVLLLRWSSFAGRFFQGEIMEVTARKK